MFRFKHLFACLATLCLLAFANTHAANPPKVGVVNFKKCIEGSKLGQKEHTAFENMKKDMAEKLQAKEKELNDIAMKFQDPDYMDTLNAEAEAELKHKFRSLSQEMGAFQNRYYQELQQANFRILQSISEVAGQASEKVAGDLSLDQIVNDENFFFYAPSMEVTDQVVAEMDRMFEQQQ